MNHEITVTLLVNSKESREDVAHMLESVLVDSRYSTSTDDGPEQDAHIVAVDAGACPLRLSPRKFMGYPQIVGWKRAAA